MQLTRSTESPLWIHVAQCHIPTIPQKTVVGMFTISDMGGLWHYFTMLYPHVFFAIKKTRLIPSRPHFSERHVDIFYTPGSSPKNTSHLHVLRVLGGAVGPIAPFLRHDEAGVVRILGTKFPHHQSGNASTSMGTRTRRDGSCISKSHPNTWSCVHLFNGAAVE